MTTPIIDRKKRARKNINLLEKADEIALSHLSKKVLKPEYRKVLTNQDEQLKYYLSTYKTPDELPTRIATEYEYPKFFHYEINSKKKGKTPKRIRLDSKMFRKFMQNKAKRALAIQQGIPIGIIRPPKNTPNQDFNLYDLYGMQEEPEPQQQLMQLQPQLLNLEELEVPTIKELEPVKLEKLTPLEQPKIEQFIPKAEITFIVPEPEPAPKDVKKDVKSIKEMIEQLHNIGDGKLQYYS